MTRPERIARELPTDRAQLDALGKDARALAHAARVERERADRASKAADHWAD